MHRPRSERSIAISLNGLTSQSSWRWYSHRSIADIDCKRHNNITAFKNCYGLLARNIGSTLEIYSDRITHRNNIRGVLVEIYNKLTWRNSLLELKLCWKQLWILNVTCRSIYVVQVQITIFRCSSCWRFSCTFLNRLCIMHAH
jgi:hypothetical protein